MKILENNYKAINSVFTRMVLQRRWTSVMTDDQYDELAKQAFNCLVTFFLACEEEHAGKPIDWTLFPKIAIHRVFQKAFVLSDISETTVEQICAMGDVSMDDVMSVNRKMIAEKNSQEFADEVCNAWNSPEARIFRAATKIATYVEFIENQDTFKGDYAWKLHEIVRELEHYSDIEGFNSLSNPSNPAFKLLETMSKLRNQNRWAPYARALDCSVLGHLFDTAVFAYYMALEQNPEDENRATKLFFMGMFHDIPEGWTKDIPSPIKDRIPGFREASEAFEMKMVEENMYSILPDYLKKPVKAMMMEDQDNAEFKPLLKGADYLSASSECLRNLIGGTRDWNFHRALHDVEDKYEAGKIILTPEALKFYHHLVKEGDKMEGSLIYY